MVLSPDEENGQDGSQESVTEKKTRRRKALPVKVIKRKGESALIEWLEKDDIQRGYVPAEEIGDDECPADVLKAAIPYGVPWESLIDDVSAAEVARCLRKHGIWTVADVEKKSKKVQLAVNEATGLHVGRLHGLARQHEKGR